MRILIVEDEIRIREGIARLLGKISSDDQVVGEAANGQEGLDLCLSLRPELIITDIKMPEMDGLEMLRAASEKGCTARAIVLSAYSEFEYARGAMKLGVTEYLLKPISLADFSQALDHINAQIREETLKKPDQVGTLEQVFRDVTSGRLAADEETLHYLETAYGIRPNQEFLLVCAYMGDAFHKAHEAIRKELDHDFSKYPGIRYLVVDSEVMESLILIFYQYENAHDLERWIQTQLLAGESKTYTLGCVRADDMNGISGRLHQLYDYMDWSISLREDVLISYPKITQMQTCLCVYPVELESQMKAAICASDPARIREIMERFCDYWSDGRLYEPREIKDSYVRMSWSMLEISKEVGSIRQEDIPHQKLLDTMMGARTRTELTGAMEKIADRLCARSQDDMSSHLAVRRAQNMIHEFYNTGITLNEIAAKLNITPEYLGTQFHKETGLTYGTYIRDYRIKRAKELLLGTSLKLYEIAEQVGYQDPKYFSKVFREVTGLLPAQYRKSMK